ncbi:DUF222 domain-containing protein [Kutzneria sp. CA-103260]|uniref:DUF222 domain-containing protein n=1 Tax=Kutzneria sp. CA-103260 TaxID=2802641 RepID=UPI001BAB7802|nr:DUF222 domain-containing protein [Kutzneria sp. CA-103260]QUQ66308.1 hypothetical protein JJ691_40350 [Kutzneria sp. CA-103260]
MEELARELESREPSGALLDLLMGMDLATLTADQQVTAFILARKIKAFADHVQLSILRDVEDTAEMAMAVHEPEQSVVRQKRCSEVLDRLPRLSELLRRGELDLRRLETVDERIVNLPNPAMVAEVEDELVEVAPGLTRTQLARRTTAQVAKVDPTGYDQRRLKAKQERRVEFTPLPDGMAQLRITLTALDARACYDILTQDARALVKDERTTDQKRADAFLDRFLGYGVDRKVKVHVTISLETLMGLTEDPGLLDGYGPIAADSARELAMHAPWRGLLLDQYRRASELGTDTYRPTTRIKEFAELNAGGTCSAPGCTTPIQELDHTIPWPTGKTAATQLKGYCAHHHHLKHGNHTVTLDSDNTLHWVTPLGRHYTTTPHQY